LETRFFYYEKTFDSVQRQTLLDIFKIQNIPNSLLKVIVDIHTLKYINTI